MPWNDYSENRQVIKFGIFTVNVLYLCFKNMIINQEKEML